ncbi:hypothetical protein [Allosphingosinicella deserti]|uniref:WYL domain-containing protein n=1 Tax=Allosphingosinicella deserti TaxID=2116704 RepID=A0A2P7QVB7_9SPHN|nr:hypothetical protein [Sphingomonas deserti]PSJ41902.1 hypothetical protein C7I55_06450 [Sphingomonas deserti]
MLFENDNEAEAALREGIARKRCVSAVYNKRTVIVAPHQMFERHGDLFIRAVTVEIDGQKPKEAKLGTFKLAGLKDVEITRKLFRPQADLLAAAEPHVADNVLTAVS